MRISDWSSDVCSSDLHSCWRSRNRAWPSGSILAEVTQIPRQARIAQQPFDPVGLVEAFVGHELEPGGALEAEPLSDFALQIGGVLPQRLEHRFLVDAVKGLRPEERHLRIGCVST